MAKYGTECPIIDVKNIPTKKEMEKKVFQIMINPFKKTYLIMSNRFKVSYHCLVKTKAFQIISNFA